MPTVWPTLLDLAREECLGILRKLELEAYAAAVSALRAQGDLTVEKRDLLSELGKVFSISTERHRAEVRRAYNDERLSTIAFHVSGPNSGTEWSIEGRRLVPLLPRLLPQTVLTRSANSAALAMSAHNATLPSPGLTGNKEVVVSYSYASPSPISPTVCTSPLGGASSSSSSNNSNNNNSSGGGGGSVGAGGNVGAGIGAAAAAAAVVPTKSPRPASPASSVVVLPSGNTVYVKSVSCSEDDEKPRKRRRTDSSSSPSLALSDGTLRLATSPSPQPPPAPLPPPQPPPPSPATATATLTSPTAVSAGHPALSGPKVGVSVTAGSLFSGGSGGGGGQTQQQQQQQHMLKQQQQQHTHHMSPVKITFTRPVTPTTASSTQKVIIVSTTAGPTFLPGILSKPHGLVQPGGGAAAPQHRAPPVLIASSSGGHGGQPLLLGAPIAVATGSSAATVSVATSSHAALHQGLSVVAGGKVGPPTKAPVMGPARAVATNLPQQMGTGSGGGQSAAQKPTIQIKQESGVKIITQQLPQSKILPKPAGVATTAAPIMVVSNPAAVVTTRLVTAPTAVSSRVASPGPTYLKTTSGNIITVVPKSLASSLGGKLLSSTVMSGTTTKITTIPVSMASKSNVIVVQKAPGKGASIQGLAGKSVVTTLLGAAGMGGAGEKGLQGTSSGPKPTILTTARSGIGGGGGTISKMIVTQNKPGGVPPIPAAKILPPKNPYTQPQVLIKPKPIATTMSMVGVSVATATHDADSTGAGDAAADEDRGEEMDSSVAMETGTTILQECVPGWKDAMDVSEASAASHSATSTIRAFMEMQKPGGVYPPLPPHCLLGTLGSKASRSRDKPRMPTIDLSHMVIPVARGTDVVVTTTTGDRTNRTVTASIKTQEGVTMVGTRAPSDHDYPGGEDGILDPQTGLFYRAPLSRLPVAATRQPTVIASTSTITTTTSIGTSSTISSTITVQPLITKGGAVPKISFAPSVNRTEVHTLSCRPALPSQGQKPLAGARATDILRMSMLEARLDVSEAAREAARAAAVAAAAAAGKGGAGHGQGQGAVTAVVGSGGAAGDEKKIITGRIIDLQKSGVLSGEQGMLGVRLVPTTARASGKTGDIAITVGDIIPQRLAGFPIVCGGTMLMSTSGGRSSPSVSNSSVAGGVAGGGGITGGAGGGGVAGVAGGGGIGVAGGGGGNEGGARAPAGSSGASVVVEPSGLLNVTAFTSQRVREDPFGRPRESTDSASDDDVDET
ncbi:BRCA2-interacting transcriptional repressor EMSY isoform X2 [Lampetra planeri]